MTLPITLSLLALLAVVAVFAGWRGSKPPDVLRGPRMTPWRLIMVTSAAVALMLLVHAMNLLGVKTGR